MIYSLDEYLAAGEPGAARERIASGNGRLVMRGPGNDDERDHVALKRDPRAFLVPDARDALMERMAELLEGEPNLFGWRADRNAFLKSPEYRAWRGRQWGDR